MDLYVVYFNPSDFPNQHVARRQTAGRGTVAIAADPLVVGTYEQVLAALPDGLTRLERDPNDDPCILEIWV